MNIFENLLKDFEYFTHNEWIILITEFNLFDTLSLFVFELEILNFP